jgi:uncharacterized protein YegJ (DUF2314 family)
VYALYFPGEPPADAQATIARLSGGYWAPVTPETLESSRSSHAIATAEMLRREQPLIDEEHLELFGRGVSAEAFASVDKHARTLVVGFAMPGNDGAAHRQSNELLARLAHERRALIWDVQTRNLFSAASWQRERVETWQGDIPDVSAHISIHMYPKGESLRAITLGMQKFGQPDVVVEHLPRSYADGMTSVMNLVCQLLVERGVSHSAGRLPVSIATVKHAEVQQRFARRALEGAARRADLRLRPTHADAGDPENELVLLEFGSDTATPAEQHSALLAAIFGAAEDPVIGLEHDSEVLAASKAAVERLLGEIKRRFSRGLGPGERLLVKGPFETDDGQGREWMWVEVTSWKDDTISGVLMNEPHAVRGLHNGSPVTVREADAFDYLLVLPNGRSEGNATGEIMERRQRARH